jgi:hypothetical protein
LIVELLIYFFHFLDRVARLLKHALLLLTETLSFLNFGLQVVNLLLHLSHFNFLHGLPLLACHEALLFLLNGGIQL